MPPPTEFGFAIEHGSDPVTLALELPAEPAVAEPPPLSLRRVESGSERPVEVTASAAAGKWRYDFSIEPAGPEAENDRLQFRAEYAAGGGPRDFMVEVRRTSCRISTALIERGAGTRLWPQTRAALLWYAWDRNYRELCGLKRFTTGLSGSDVFVFRPRLADPAGSADLPEPSWGSGLLVKTARRESLREEWDRFERHLTDRLHPFMARNEALLDALPAVSGPGDRDQVTLIGSFLGGELLQVESFETLVRGSADAARCHAAVDKLSTVLSAWHAGAGVRPLGAWGRVYRDSTREPLLTGAPPRVRRRPDGDWFGLSPLPPEKKLLLFGGYDLESKPDRKKYSGGVEWDMYFYRSEHLCDHLLGAGGNRDGLLYRLMALPVRYSLTHGDLHPRNVLASREDVWLLDFGETGHGPTLYDFTKFEVYLRLWCLDLKPTTGDLDAAAARFEALLLDHMTGSEGSVESVADLSEQLGARRHELLKLAGCIARVRRRAAAAGTGCPDRRDYLAVLYLTTLETLQYAGRNPELAENHRLLVALAWLLEDALSRVVGLDPPPRPRAALDHRTLVSASWLAAPGAPARVRYLMDREDGRRALSPLAATRGVLQSPAHHLDVFDHTLLVLAYLEALAHAEDPLAGFFAPGGLDREVERTVREQGLGLLPVPGGAPPTAPDEVPSDDPIWNHSRSLIRGWLDDTTRLVLKWSVLFHDVGKPATRCLNTEGKKGPKIQFIGHELYGLQLVAGDQDNPGHLDLYFPDPARRGRVADLILRHHAHHQWVTRYEKEKPGELARLDQADHLGAVPLTELEYLGRFWEPGADPHVAVFLDLLFHGFADALAARGPDTPIPVARVAAVDRTVLRLYGMYGQARAAHAAEFDRRFDELTSRGLTPKRDLAGRLWPWFLHETALGAARKTLPLPTDAFVKKAREMNGKPD